MQEISPQVCVHTLWFNLTVKLWFNLTVNVELHPDVMVISSHHLIG